MYILLGGLLLAQQGSWAMCIHCIVAVLIIVSSVSELCAVCIAVESGFSSSSELSTRRRDRRLIKGAICIVECQKSQYSFLHPLSEQARLQVEEGQWKVLPCLNLCIPL